MKVFSTIMKILAAVAAVVGIVYVAATYGDKIVAWAKNLLCRCQCGCCGDECCCEPTDAEADALTEEEAAAEEAGVQAEENDFEG